MRCERQLLQGDGGGIALLLHYSIICNNAAVINVLVHVLYDSGI